MEEYICKIASIDEMNEKWDHEIKKASEDKENWIIWKKEAIDNARLGKSIPYYGILNGKIVCEATAILDGSIIQNPDKLVDDETIYLSAFRTNKEHQGKGYFSQLFKFMINDIKSRGYKKVTLGVDPKEIKNKAIYNNYGFCEYIKFAKEKHPDGTEIDVEYYGREI